MPGVADLKAGDDRLTIRYEDEPAGARLTYETADPKLIGALHSWFDVQVSDHGSHTDEG
jgi:hypothetical protein